MTKTPEPPDPADDSTGDQDMQTNAMQNESTRPSTPAGDGRALRILAKSVYRELRSSGHNRSDIVGFTNALLELVTTEIKDGTDD